MKKVTDSEMHEKKLAPHSRYRKKNRYNNILPYEHSRVKLMDRSDSKKDSSDVERYINANFVDSPLRNGDSKIIAS